jgi:NAD dependent epimerase/dehydratase family enzyme
VSIDDEVRAILFALEHTRLHGPMNVTAPGPVTNRDFTGALAGALRRPAVLAVPKPALALALGPGITDEMILASQRALPTALQSASFEFAQPQLDGALTALLHRRD